MSARDKLRACFPALPEGESNDLIEAAVDEILNDHAQELADRILAEISLRGIPSDGGAIHYRVAAELIRPGAQQ